MFFTNDPASDEEEYYAEEERRAEKETFAICHECGNRIYYGDRYAKEDGHYICAECWEDRLNIA